MSNRVGDASSPRKEVWGSAKRFGRVPDVRKLRPNLIIFFSFSKLLVVVLEPVSVDELVSVENAPSAPLRDLDKYPRKLMVSGMMEN